MSSTLVAPTTAAVASSTTAGDASSPLEPIVEHKVEVDDVGIGYQRYGRGAINFLWICGGVGCYKKDYPDAVLRAFDPATFTIVCIGEQGG